MFFKSILIIVIFSLSSHLFAAEDLKSALKEGKFSGQFRSYFFQRDYDVRNTREDFATGGMLYYTSGDLYGISFGFAFYTGQGMGLNDDDRDVYGLLDRDANGDHKNFTVPGEAYIKAVFHDTTLKLGRQEHELPWVNTDDNRLTPQSTNAYTIINSSINDLELLFSYITKMRGKASDSFVSMTEYADIPADKHVSAFGLTYKGISDLELYVWDFYAKDFINNIYMKAIYSDETAKGLAWHVTGQYLKQDDTGDRLGGSVDTHMYGLEAGIEKHGLSISLAVSDIGDDDVIYPWGHDFFVSAIVNDLYQADGKGWMATLAYDFAEVGIPGLTSKIVYADMDTPDSGRNASTDVTEKDITLTYKFKGLLEGLGIRTRYGIIGQDESLGGEDYNDLRIQLTYDFEI
ncbi:MAG: OprD family outer membrane porin [Deltaproteobacteria bacterium]|nr:OprD family outer membrane porin [Deltaproteobacteria bacterium]